MKATKTFKIGEQCRGGVLTVEINGNQIHIIAKDWDGKAGWSRNSNQSNAKEFDRLTIGTQDAEARHKAFMFLTDLTSAYYADETIKWIESKVGKLSKSWW